MEYTTVGLPKPFAERFHDIMSFFGYASSYEKASIGKCILMFDYLMAYRTFSEFVVETVRQRLQEMETKYELHQFEKERKDKLE